MNPQTKTPGHEKKDVDVPSLMIIALLLLVSGVIIFFVVSGLMRYFKLHEAESQSSPTAPVTAVQKYPGPRLEVRPAMDLAKLRAAEELDLHSYGWIDRKSGTVRVPIDRAIQLLLERGLPDVGAGKTPLSLMQARPLERATPPRLMENK